MWLPLGVAYAFCDPNVNKSLDDPYPPLRFAGEARSAT
jgi:hypothetical protein